MHCENQYPEINIKQTWFQKLKSFLQKSKDNLIIEQKLFALRSIKRFTFLGHAVFVWISFVLV